MKLRNLTINNIASIADCTIDFDSGLLADAGIFLITGPTGAGKSTILDAVCLAIYGDTPRLDKAPRNSSAREIDSGENGDARDTRQLLRRGTGKGYAELSFRGNDGKEYVARWNVRRSRGKASGSLMNATRSVICLDDGTEATRIKELKEVVSRAVGLDFDQFCRTAMLAQGDFTRFLNAKDDEKAAILEKITRVGIYSRIGAAIFNRCNSAEKDYRAALAAAEAITALSPEEEAALSVKLKEAAGALARAEKNEKAVEAHIAYRDAVADAASDVAVARSEALRAAEAANAPDVEKRRRLVAEWRESVEPRADLAAARHAAGAAADARRRLSAMKPLIAAHAAALASLREAIAAKNADISRLAAEVEIEPAEAKRLAAAPEIRVAAELLKSATAMHAAENVKIKEYDGKLEALSARIVAAGNSASTLAAAAEAAGRLYDSLKDTLNRFASSSRQQLALGCRCPVCLQEVKTLPPAEAEIKRTVESLKGAADEARSKADIAARELDRLIREKENICVELKPAAERNRDRHGAECERLRSELKKLGVDASRFAGIDSLIADAQQMAERLERLRTMEKRLAGLRGEADRLRAQEEEAAAVMARVSEACPVDPGITPSHLSKPAWADLQTTVVGLDDRISLEDMNEKAARARLEAFLAPRRDRYTEERLEALSAHKSFFIDNEDRALTELATKVTATRHALAVRLLTLRRASRRRPDTLPFEGESSLEERLALARNARTEAAESLASLRAEMRSGHERRDEKSRLTEEARQRRTVFERWSGLNSLFGSATGQKFQRIAQSMVLSSLAMSANHYMATLSPRYTLRVVPGTFTILVEDAWQGYACRPVSTVSGGESFLVSLALALALSDISSVLAVDTLFIDEGFGTLSGDALGGALDTLRSLQSRGSRRVGIISHVDALRDRIPVHITVAREGLTGPASVTVAEA